MDLATNNAAAAAAANHRPLIDLNNHGDKVDNNNYDNNENNEMGKTKNVSLKCSLGRRSNGKQI